jgi:hypothetical protein
VRFFTFSRVLEAFWLRSLCELWVAQVVQIARRAIALGGGFSVRILSFEVYGTPTASVDPGGRKTEISFGFAGNTAAVWPDQLVGKAAKIRATNGANCLTVLYRNGKSRLRND